MQRWSLKEFSPEPVAAGPDAPEGLRISERPAGGLESLFRRDNLKKDRATLLSLMTAEERNAVYTMIEADLAEVFQRQAAEQTAAQKAELERWLHQFADALRQETAARMQLFARQTANLAVTLAERVIRHRIGFDREVLVRAVENILVRLDAGTRLHLKVHPEEAQWLGEDPELMRRLQITKVTPDRRVEKGGCLVDAAGQEWDATIPHQVGALAEVVNEVLSGDFELPEVLDEDDQPLG